MSPELTQAAASGSAQKASAARDRAAGDGAVIIATGPHREGIQERLTANGWDLAALSRQGRFLALDAGETLAKLCLDEFPSASRSPKQAKRLRGWRHARPWARS